MTSTRTLALRFLAGRLEGGVVPIDPECTLIVGRQPGADVLLAEDLVSRRHARVTRHGDDVAIEDLGSTNGTFVNGVRVEHAPLAEGDRVLIGETVFTLASLDPARRADATEVRTLIERAVITSERRPASAIQGRLEEVRLHAVLQLLANGRKTGRLSIRREGHVAEVLIERGHVVGCSLDGRDDHAPRKILFRLFDWTSGQFELRPSPDPDDASVRPLADSTDLLLMEAARHVDEMRRVRAAIPARLTVRGTPPASLDGDDRALLALAASLGDLDAVLDATPLPDLVAAERLAALHALGLLVQPQAARERTAVSPGAAAASGLGRARGGGSGQA